MFLIKKINASSLKYLKVTPDIQDKLATKLVQIDPTFVPPNTCPNAEQARQALKISPKSLYSEDMIHLRIYGLPLFLLLLSVFYIYHMLKLKRRPITDFQDKDYEKLTLWQLKQKENLARQERQFDSILDALQNKLKDEYQETLHEFQDFISESKK